MVYLISRLVRRRLCSVCCVLVGVCATLGLFFLGYRRLLNRRPTSNDFQLDFTFENYGSCEQLLPAEGFSMSPSFRLKSPAFNKTVHDTLNGTNHEGYSGPMEEVYMMIHYLTGQPVVRSVCETGFNLGSSSFNYLTANDFAVVHSFDIGRHFYTRPMAKYLKEIFPMRFNIHFGDSTQTIPEFIRANPDFRCDVMYVDGGHVYPIALADIKNFAKIANLDRNLIIFDDYPSDWGMDFGKAWEDMVKEGIVVERLRCTHTSDRKYRFRRGFVIGRVVKRTG